MSEAGRDRVVLIKPAGVAIGGEDRYAAVIEVDATARWGGDTGYALSLHKAGSTLMNGVIKMLCAANDAAFVSIPSDVRSLGFPPHRNVDVWSSTVPETGAIFGGFRSLPTYELPRLDTAPKALLVRDPRDILTSHYFSVALSHNAPGDGPTRKRFETYREEVANSDIDSVVMARADVLLRTIRRYLTRLPQRNLAVYRYEDVIMKKPDWITDMAAHFGLETDDRLVARILERYDILPDRENPDDHIRQVLPGDYKRKLSAQTITALDEMFSGIYDPLLSLRRSV